MLEAWARAFLRPDRPTPTLELLTGMIHGIRRGLTYVRRTEKGIQSPAETLPRGSGTCRDFTELMIEALRSLGLPARFVSGYLYVPERDRARGAWRRLDACLGAGLPSGRRLDRHRPDQRHPRQ